MNLELIHHKIHSVRNQNVILDFDLAILYEVETKRLNEAVKRNSMRFPEKFMFRLSQEEWKEMRSQIATASEQNKRNLDITPFAFTEHGVAMIVVEDFATRGRLSIMTTSGSHTSFINKQ